MAKNILTDEIKIYASVGRSLTTWGMVEDAVGLIYSSALNPRDRIHTERAYWAINSFENRLKMTGDAVRSRLQRKPQEIRTWIELSAELAKQNRIRNKIAHGTVMMRHPEAIKRPGQWFLAPYYFGKRGRELSELMHKKRAVGQVPKEQISRSMIEKHRRAFFALQERVKQFFYVVEREACKQEGVPIAKKPEDQFLLTALSTLKQRERLQSASKVAL